MAEKVGIEINLINADEAEATLKRIEASTKDAAIIYALGEHKDELTYEDLQVDSPYNTYTHTGLTPGPISNPGLYSLNAALDPDDTDYYYYAMDPDTGAHHFSESEYEHNRFLDSLED